MIVLGIETSCDETCSAVLEYDKTNNVIFYQILFTHKYQNIKITEVLCLRSPPDRTLITLM